MSYNLSNIGLSNEVSNLCEITIQEFTKSQFFFLGLMTYLLSIVFHELGHWFMLWANGRKTAFYFGFKNNRLFCGTGDHLDYIGLDNESKNSIYAVGILTGLIPIALVSFLFNPAYWILLAPYILGCWKDIKLILKLMVVD
jgi:hypothetical protein